MTVTCPTAAVSHVMLEAYKKYLLLTLIVHGDKPKVIKGRHEGIRQLRKINTQYASTMMKIKITSLELNNLI